MNRDRIHHPLSTWLLPSLAARGPLRRLNLAVSYALHVGGMGLLALGLILMYPSEFTDLVRDIVNDPQPPSGELLGLAFFIVFTELMYLLAALLTVCWGAGVEPFRQSYYRTLGRWYQLTPWHAALTLALFVGMELMDTVNDWMYYQPDLSGVIGYEWARLIVQSGYTVSVGGYVLLGLWSTLATLAVHRDNPRWFASCRWPGQCETCGYELAGLDIDHGCPECGRTVRSSLYTRRGPLNNKSAHIMSDAVFRPGSLGARLLTRCHTNTPTNIFLIAMGLTILAGPVGMLLIGLGETIDGGWYGNDSAAELFTNVVLSGLLVGVFMMLGALLMALTVASLLAAFTRLVKRRNALPTYCKAACLASGIMPIWVLSNFAFIGFMIATYEHLENLFPYASEVAAFGLWAGINLLWLAWYAFTVDRIAKAARYANV